MKALGRALRRAGLPIAYSQGFHPLPRLALGPPLPLGIESYAEYADLVFTELLPEMEIKQRLNSELPPGLEVTEVKRVLGKVPSLSAAIDGLEYAFFLKNLTLGNAEEKWDEVRRRLQELWANPSLQVVRKKGKQIKEVDIRPLWKGYTLSQINQELLQVNMEVEFGNRGTIRPEDILSFIPSGCKVERIIRVAAWIGAEGVKRTPLAIL